jgi:hypothetical protein
VTKTINKTTPHDPKNTEKRGERVVEVNQTSIEPITKRNEKTKIKGRGEAEERYRLGDTAQM